MPHRVPRLGVLAVCGILVGLPVPATASRTAPKPSIKVLGFSVNRYYATKGSTVKANDPTNACYIIGGASGEPPQLVVYVYVHAVKIPRGAHLTYTFSTPWDKVAPEQKSYDGKFSGGLFKAHGKQQASIYGGPTGTQDYFTYRMLPTGTPASYYIDGKYSLNVRVQAGGKTLTSYGKITVAC